MAESSGSACWTTLVAQYAENRVISVELYQQLLLFVARRALAKARTYLPGFQWENLHGHLSWKLIREELALQRKDFREAFQDANDEACDDGTNDAKGIPVDVDRFVDAVRKVVQEKLIKAIEGRSGFLKLSARKLTEFQIQAWLKRTVDRMLREYWRKNRPKESNFFETSRHILQKHFVLVHDGRRHGDGIGCGFYSIRKNWWGLCEWQHALPRPLSEYELLQKLESVEFVVPRSARKSPSERAAALRNFFLACFETVGGPMPEGLLIDEAKKFFGVTDNDLPISLDGQAHQSEDGKQRSFEEILPDGNSKADFHLLLLEPVVRALTEKMSSRERRVAKSLYRELDKKANRTAPQTENHPDGREDEEAIPRSTYYWIRKKIFQTIRAEGLGNFDLILNLLEKNLEVTVGEKTGS